MSRIKEWCAALCAIMCALSAAAARAHAPPEIHRVVWSPNGDRVVLVTNRGLVFKAAQSGGWSMMCGAALGGGPVSETEGWKEPDVAYLQDGRLLAATPRGLRVTSDGGCAWRAEAPFESVPTSVLAQHPSEPNTLFLGLSGSEGSIQKSRDGGASWSRALALAGDELATSLLFAPMQPARIYATLAKVAGGAPSHALLRSADMGATWKRVAIPVRAGERLARLVAVSPRDPELLLVLVKATDAESDPDRILLSRNGGESYNELWSSVGLHDAGFGPDGGTVWIAGDEALWRSDEALSALTPVGMAQLVTCVGAHAGSLYVCGHHSGFDPPNSGVGMSKDGAQTFERFMTITAVKTRVSCESSSETALACQADWTDWQLEILVALGGAPIDSVLGDAGMAGLAAEDAGVPPASVVDSGSAGTSMPKPGARAEAGCAVSGTGGASTGYLLVSGLAWSFALRRRRAARSG